MAFILSIFARISSLILGCMLLLSICPSVIQRKLLCSSGFSFTFLYQQGQNKDIQNSVSHLALPIHGLLHEEVG